MSPGNEGLPNVVYPGREPIELREVDRYGRGQSGPRKPDHPSGCARNPGHPPMSTPCCNAFMIALSPTSNKDEDIGRDTKRKVGTSRRDVRNNQPGATSTAHTTTERSSRPALTDQGRSSSLTSRAVLPICAYACCPWAFFSSRYGGSTVSLFRQWDLGTTPM